MYACGLTVWHDLTLYIVLTRFALRIDRESRGNTKRTLYAREVRVSVNISICTGNGHYRSYCEKGMELQGGLAFVPDNELYMYTSFCTEMFSIKTCVNNVANVIIFYF